MSIKLNTSFAGDAASAGNLSAIQSEITAAHRMLHDGTGVGNAFLGWVDLPVNYDKEEFAAIKRAAEKIRKNSEVLIVIGIGGSYLGARAAIEFVKSQRYNLTAEDSPEIYFAGNSISSSALTELVELCSKKDFSVNVISKSGTTTEPALAFRIFRDLLIKKYGAEGAKERIFATTDKSKGALRGMADEEGYETFVVPDDVGGRYSVLTAVGLLPIAAAGIDIDALMKGAADAREAYLSDKIDENDCYRYAAIRNILYRSGKKIETTTQLKETIEQALSFLPEDKEKKEILKKTCQRTFQALRIDVNSEFEVLEAFLNSLPDVLGPGGRAAILTFHSGEDRMVKKAFKRGQKEGLYSEVAKDVIRPSAEECRQNPRARSTKMRWAIKAE